MSAGRVDLQFNKAWHTSQSQSFEFLRGLQVEKSAVDHVMSRI